MAEMGAERDSLSARSFEAPEGTTTSLHVDAVQQLPFLPEGFCASGASLGHVSSAHCSLYNQNMYAGCQTGSLAFEWRYFHTTTD